MSICEALPPGDGMPHSIVVDLGPLLFNTNLGVLYTVPSSLRYVGCTSYLTQMLHIVAGLHLSVQLRWEASH